MDAFLQLERGGVPKERKEIRKLGRDVPHVLISLVDIGGPRQKLMDHIEEDSYARRTLHRQASAQKGLAQVVVREEHRKRLIKLGARGFGIDKSGASLLFPRVPIRLAHVDVRREVRAGITQTNLCNDRWVCASEAVPRVGSVYGRRSQVRLEAFDDRGPRRQDLVRPERLEILKDHIPPKLWGVALEADRNVRHVRSEAHSKDGLCMREDAQTSALDRPYPDCLVTAAGGHKSAVA
eukprot:scaffold889_cov268-Pinguiococcus_pyrenoidosus.AAC.19